LLLLFQSVGSVVRGGVISYLFVSFIWYTFSIIRHWTKIFGSPVINHRQEESARLVLVEVSAMLDAESRIAILLRICLAAFAIPVGGKIWNYTRDRLGGKSTLLFIFVLVVSVAFRFLLLMIGENTLVKYGRLAM